MAASTEQRRERILAEVYRHGHVAVKDLAEGVGVSEPTVRRDLRALAREGRIETYYGGASVPRHSDYSFHAKQMRSTEAKALVGRLAAGLIRDGEQVFLDSGTTCYELARQLKPRRGLKIIVNSARLATELDGANLEVILLGGQYRPDRQDTVGPLATATLDQLRGYLCFVGADGVSRDFGLTANDIESADLYRRAIANARETILLVDHTKFASPSLFKIVNFDAVSRVVTDRVPDRDWMDFFDAHSIDVITPGLADAGGPEPNEPAEPASAQPARPGPST